MKVATRGDNSDYSLAVALGVYSLFWMALAIHPFDRRDWFLENLLVFVTVIVLGSTYRRFQFSKKSYILILAFLAIHTIGAHYTYAKVPLGFWMQDWLHLQRNHYDRVIHFSFGLLLVYPMRDLLMNSARAHKPWATWLSVVALAALSSFFEIVEAIVAQIVRPDLGAAYLGTQGDMWDAQKDMAAAFIDAIVAAVWLFLRRPRA
jgi:putative membrane protein